MIKRIFFLLLVAGLLFFVWWTLTSRTYETIEPDIAKELSAKVNQDYLAKHIQIAIKTENFDDVQMYQNLAKILDINLNAHIQEKIVQESTIVKQSWRNLKAFGSGFISGKSDSAVGIGGSITSDMTLYGDLRDLKAEGTKYSNNEPYDKCILQLSALGVGLSATQILSVGVTTPLKVGVSLMKVAKKSGKLTKPFMKIISKKLSKTIDMKVLKSYNPKRIAKNINITPLKELLDEIGSIKKFTSTADTIALLKYADNIKDLRKIHKLSKTYKANTKGVLKVLGKRALRAGKSVLKISSKLLLGAMGIVFSFVGLLLMMFSFHRSRKG